MTLITFRSASAHFMKRRPIVRHAMGLLAIVALVATSIPAAGDDSTLPAQIEELQRELRELRRTVERTTRGVGPSDDVDTAELERRIEILATEVERLRVGDAATAADSVDYGLGPAASKIYRTKRGVSIGGYGEMLYERFADDRDDGEPSGKTDQLDFLRAIVYVGYKFDDKWLLNTEIEFEHASTGESGEASVEFAYIDYLHRPGLNFRAGLLLLPVGLVNELHEPTVFLGARRPHVENAILPTTWREPGIGVFGDLGPVTYRSYVLTGLDAGGFNSSGIRGGRQKGSKAKAESLAWVGRLDYTARPGLVAGVSLYTGDSGQGMLDDEGRELGVRTTLFDGHLSWSHRGLDVRALYTQATIDDAARLNSALGIEDAASVGEQLRGAYVQVGYDLASRMTHGPSGLTPYIRWEQWNTQHQVPAPYSASLGNEGRSITVGVAVKPIEQIVIKADYQDMRNEADTATNQFNLALGYVF